LGSKLEHRALFACVCGEFQSRRLEPEISRRDVAVRNITQVLRSGGDARLVENSAVLGVCQSKLEKFARDPMSTPGENISSLTGDQLTDF